MTEETRRPTVGGISTPSTGDERLPAVLTRLVWVLWIASLGALVVQFRGDGSIGLPGVAVLDGLTVVMWVAVTFFSGVVHSYARRYMAGSRTIERFFGSVFAFTLVVMALVAADSLLLFWLCWLAMGLLMADLIGHADGWPQARAAGALARRYFFASSGLLAVALLALWWATGETTVSGLASAVASPSSGLVLFAAGALLLAAMVQSALVPFHTWLLSSMTAPTPASALMHAGFVNAGGILLVRFAPVVTVESGFMLVVVVVGAVSALLGKLLKTVQTDIKGELGCSTVGQMGFMIMQAGLGFFAAAVTHLILHGFYKAYRFLGSGAQVTHEGPAKTTSAGSTTFVGVATIALTAIAGGGLFATLTGKGTKLDGGLLLMLLVVLTVLHAVRAFVSETALSAGIRYGAVPLVALPAIVVYAAVYGAVEEMLAGLPAVGQPVELTAVHVVVAGAFVAAYLGIETGVHRASKRLYVTLLNATQPASETLLTATEDYNEY